MRRVIMTSLAVLTMGVPVLLESAPASAADCSVSSYRVQTDSSHRSDQVRCIQTTLNAKGFNSGPIDGWFGPITRAAVVAYQARNRLIVDGEVGSQTAGALGVWIAPPRAVRVQVTDKATNSHSTNSHSTTRHHSTFRTGASGVNWDAVARCESGGQWSHSLVTNHVGTFGGGLMIMQSAWRQYGGGQFASTPGGASRAEQIIVAERIAARVGAARAWQCPTPHG